VLNDEDLARMSEFSATTRRTTISLLLARCPAPTKRCVLHPRLGHDQFGRYTENPPEYQEVVDRLKKKHAASAEQVPAR